MSFYFKRFSILICFLVGFNLSGQLPLPNARLVHSTVYFEEQFVKKAKQYQLFLSAVSLGTEIVKQIQNHIPAFWIEDLNWGSSYFWNISALDEKGIIINKSPIHKFTIQKKINALYVKDTRLDIKTNVYENNMGGYILLDHSHAIYDRKGKQVWALPEAGRLFDERKLIRDLNVSPYNTITVLAGPVPVELDFEGRVLWKAPFPMILGKDTLVYHHDFKRHANGHYFVLANKKVMRQVVGNYADSLTRDESGITRINDTLYKRTLHGLLLEFDENGKFSDEPKYKLSGWFIPARMLVDPTAGIVYDLKTNESTKLMRLGNEGRSTATTILSNLGTLACTIIYYYTCSNHNYAPILSTFASSNMS